jgi:DNA-binding winged helix-turn-helix (wHTH) protein
MDPEHLRQFEVGIAVLCQRLREVNQLGGDAISSYGRTVHFLGDTDASGRRVSLVLARCLQPRSADRTLHAIRGRWPERSLLVLTPTTLALDPGLRANLKSNELVVVGISELLVNTASLELALGRISGLFAWSPVLGPGVILYADRAAHEMSFQGEALTLPSREFKLLLLLMESAQKNPRGWVSRRAIHDVLWPECASGGLVYDLQIHDAIKKVRRVLDAIEPEAGARTIKMQRGAGYRLAVSVRSIAVV